MDSEEQGYNDFWHYDNPRQPTNALYMKGWNEGWDTFLEGNEDEDYDDDPDGNIEY